MFLLGKDGIEFMLTICVKVDFSSELSVLANTKIELQYKDKQKVYLKPKPEPKRKPEPKPKQAPKPFWFRLCTQSFTCDEEGRKPRSAECMDFIRSAEMVMIPAGSQNEQTIQSFVTSISDWSEFEFMPLAIDYYDERDDMIIDACVEKTFQRELYKPTDYARNLQRLFFELCRSN